MPGGLEAEAVDLPRDFDDAFDLCEHTGGVEHHLGNVEAVAPEEQASGRVLRQREQVVLLWIGRVLSWPARAGIVGEPPDAARGAVIAAAAHDWRADRIAVEILVDHERREGNELPLMFQADHVGGFVGDGFAEVPVELIAGRAVFDRLPENAKRVFSLPS